MTLCCIVVTSLPASTVASLMGDVIAVEIKSGRFGFKLFQWPK